MESVRKFHNSIKKKLLEQNVRKDHRVLDVGCGCGGDIHKWNHIGCTRIDMCDPDLDSVREAQMRIDKMEYNFKVSHGDILTCGSGQYDIICYNFSLQYIFENEPLFFKSINRINDLLKHNGGKLIGCIPDSDMIYTCTPFVDRHGNSMFMDDDHKHVHVKLADSPFYKDNKFKKEPIAFRDLLVTHLELLGIHLENWSHFPDNNEVITKMYSTFIFVKV